MLKVFHATKLRPFWNKARALPLPLPAEDKSWRASLESPSACNTALSDVFSTWQRCMWAWGCASRAYDEHSLNPSPADFVGKGSLPNTNESFHYLWDLDSRPFANLHFGLPLPGWTDWYQEPEENCTSLGKSPPVVGRHHQGPTKHCTAVGPSQVLLETSEWPRWRGLVQVRQHQEPNEDHD